MTIRSGLRTPIDAIPTPDFAVPYAAPVVDQRCPKKRVGYWDEPKQVKTMAEVQPIAPKNGA